MKNNVLASGSKVGKEQVEFLCKSDQVGYDQKFNDYGFWENPFIDLKTLMSGPMRSFVQAGISRNWQSNTKLRALKYIISSLCKQSGADKGILARYEAK